MTTDEAAEGRSLMNARRLAYPALERLGTALLDDVSVPVATIPELLAGIEAIAARTELTVATFGHAGDGNMHPTVIYDAADPGSTAEARRAFADIVSLALELEAVPVVSTGSASSSETRWRPSWDPSASFTTRSRERSTRPGS